VRNYCRLVRLRALIEEFSGNTSLGTFENTFVARDPDELFDAFATYARAFQGTHRYVLRNPDDWFYTWIELSRENVYKMFRLLACSFDNVVTMWEDKTTFSGALPDEVEFDLFVDESPKDTWSNGK